MRFRRFYTRGFRNLKPGELVLGPGVTAVVGKNAAGKTNLLEGLYLAAGGEMRGTIAERIAFGEGEALLGAELRGYLGDFEVEQRLLPTKRLFFLNRAPASHRELLALPGAVWLSPGDLFVIKGPPEERRRFLDTLISRFSPRYRALLAAYERAVRQRNAALKAGGRGVEPFSHQVATLGAEIMELRRRAVERLEPLVAEVYRVIAPGEVSLSLKESTSPKRLAAALSEHLGEELERGATLFGPHRDDLRILLSGRDATRFSSRGEARTLALALRLAEHRMLEEHHGEPPVLLLDDVVSELDEERQRALIAYIRGVEQAVVTATKPPEGADRVVEIKEGAWEVVGA